MESILDLDCTFQTQATRTFLINLVEIFGALAKNIKELEDKNGVIGTYFTRLQALFFKLPDKKCGKKENFARTA